MASGARAGYTAEFMATAVKTAQASGSVVTREIADKLGVPAETLRGWVRRANAGQPLPQRIYTLEFRQQVLRDLAEPGATLKSVAAKHGIAIGSIKNWHKEEKRNAAEQAPAPEPAAEAAPKPKGDEDKQAAIAMVRENDGQVTAAIAEAAGVSTIVLSNWWRAARNRDRAAELRARGATAPPPTPNPEPQAPAPPARRPNGALPIGSQLARYTVMWDGVDTPKPRPIPPGKNIPVDGEENFPTWEAAIAAIVEWCKEEMEELASLMQQAKLWHPEGWAWVHVPGDNGGR